MVSLVVGVTGSPSSGVNCGRNVSVLLYENVGGGVWVVMGGGIWVVIGGGMLVV